MLSSHIAAVALVVFAVAGCARLNEPLVRCDDCPVTKVCRPQWKEPEKKKCHDVECEHVCIPPVRLPPWLDCEGAGGDQCATVIVVKKHKEREVAGPCKIEYKAVCPCCGREKCGEEDDEKESDSNSDDEESEEKESEEKESEEKEESGEKSE